jgi:hypothetical protein
LDTAQELIEIARLRSPDGGFLFGGMFELRFDDASFECATSFKGIWKGCGSAGSLEFHGFSMRLNDPTR